MIFGVHFLTLAGEAPSFSRFMPPLRAICGLFFTACFLLAVSSSLAQPPKPPVDGHAEAAALLQQARDYEASGDTKRASSIYRDIVKRYSISSSAPAAQFRVAELIEQSGNKNKAFDAYAKLIENYPQSREFERAATAQLAIADDFMHRRRYERAEEMYKSILASAPYAKFAPAAQFKLGQSLENRKEYDKAVAAYQIIVDRYSTSDYADDALYQIGFVQLSEARSRSKDLSAAIDAKNTFDEFLMEYPNSEKAAQARENLALMSGRETTDILSIAKFYDRSNNYRAAVIYYSDLVRRQPGSEDAKLANERIEEIRATVGDEELRSSPEREETGDRVAMRRRMANQVETSALSNYAGPPTAAVAPKEELPPPRPQLRTSTRDVRPLDAGSGLMPPTLPSVEPELPIE